MYGTSYIAKKKNAFQIFLISKFFDFALEKIWKAKKIAPFEFNGKRSYTGLGEYGDNTFSFLGKHFI